MQAPRKHFEATLSGIEARFIRYVDPEANIDNMATNDIKAPVLEGEDAKEFLEYVRRPLSNEEKESLSDAHRFYMKCSKVR